MCDTVTCDKLTTSTTTPITTGSGRTFDASACSCRPSATCSLGGRLCKTLHNALIVDKNVSNLDAERAELQGVRATVFARWYGARLCWLCW
jgi:hypothetical protein